MSWPRRLPMELFMLIPAQAQVIFVHRGTPTEDQIRAFALLNAQASVFGEPLLLEDLIKTLF